jgi:cytochrome c-type biogenesis protein CcmH
VVLAAALPVTALALYAAFGNPGAMRATVAADERQPMSHEQIASMVETLANRMKERPEDPKGWQLLARAYAAMGRFGDSVAAFSEAARRGPEDASLLADWADALAMKNQSLQGEPARLVARALALDPIHPKALSLSASVALDRKDFDTAIAEWRKLQAQFPAGSEEAKEVTAMIAEAESAKGGTPLPPAASANAAPSAVTANAPANSNAEASAITGKVALDPTLRDKAGAGDTLFIFARAANGPRMPLAIVRATAGELPREFKLDDSLAMTSAARLSTTDQVTIEARISKSGSATPSPGDLRGSSPTVKPGARDVLIVINDVVR